MSVAISWANKRQFAKCDIMVSFPVSSHKYILSLKTALLFSSLLASTNSGVASLTVMPGHRFFAQHS